MALPNTVVSELLGFRAGDVVERESVQLVIQELIEAEAAQVIGADRYEVADTRVTERNASHPRLLST
jgi:putative transposase